MLADWAVTLELEENPGGTVIRTSAGMLFVLACVYQILVQMTWRPWPRSTYDRIKIAELPTCQTSFVHGLTPSSTSYAEISKQNICLSIVIISNRVLTDEHVMRYAFSKIISLFSSNHTLLLRIIVHPLTCGSQVQFFARSYNYSLSASLRAWSQVTVIWASSE